MHRVNIQTNRTAVLRLVAYALTILLSALTTILLLYVALGYRFNSSGEIIQSGLLLVNNEPVAGKVYINGELKDSQSPSRFVLPVGQYELSLEQSGYIGWKKNFAIKAEVVERVDYPLLIPKQIATQTQLTLTDPNFVSQSGDRKFLLTHSAGSQSIQKITLNAAESKQASITLPSAFKREAGSTGTLAVIEWSLDNKQVLVTQTLPSGSVSVIAFNLASPVDSINLSEAFGATPLTDLHFVGKQTDKLYGISDGRLMVFNLETKSLTELDTGVHNYQPYGDDTQVFTRTSKDGLTIEVGLRTNKTVAVLERFTDLNQRPLVSYGEYDDHTYVVVSDTTGAKARVYRDSLKKPILKKQIPFVLLAQNKTEYIKFSPNNQYVLLQHGTDYVSYDFENIRMHQFEITNNLQNKYPAWLTNAHILYQTTDGQNYIQEFDGANKLPLVKSDINKPLYLGSNPQTAYRLVTNNDSVSLDSVSLVAK